MGELRPGDRPPPEPELAAAFGVSRTALREATKTMCGLGVLRARRRGGTCVAAQFSPRMLDPLNFGLIIERGSPDELYELRVLLEVDAAELARLDERLEAFAALLPSGAPGALSREDLASHHTLLEIGGNQSFARVAAAIRARDLPRAKGLIESAFRESAPIFEVERRFLDARAALCYNK